MIKSCMHPSLDNPVPIFSIVLASLADRGRLIPSIARWLEAAAIAMNKCILVVMHSMAVGG